jgi:polycomb protein EED
MTTSTIGGDAGTIFEPLPQGFRLGAAAIAKEQHKHPLYCVAWSTDIFSSPEGNDKDAGHSNRNDNPITPAESDSDFLLAENGPIWPAPLRSGGSGTGVDSKREVGCAPSPTQVGDSIGSGKESSPVRCFATCGGNSVTIYEAAYGSGMNLRQAYRDVDLDESLYACAFGGRSIGSRFGHGSIGHVDATGSIILRHESEVSSAAQNIDYAGSDFDSSDDEASLRWERGLPSSAQEPVEKRRKILLQDFADLSKNDGPQLLCVAGRRGIVKVIDTVRRSLVLTLSGHGDEIYDIKFSPTDEWLLLTASKDESLRLWNVKHATCVAIFAGHEGHRDSVLSCSWHPLGQLFASAGMDTTVKVWSLEGNEVKDARRKSSLVVPTCKKGLDASSSGARPSAARPKVFNPACVQIPVFSTSKIHLDYCDCVQFVGDLLLSKSIDETIVLWKPVMSDDDNDKSIGRRRTIRNDVVALRDFDLRKCAVWFVRFQTDANCRMLAAGNNVGDIKVWDVGASNPTKKPFASLNHHHCTSTIRMVSFSPDARCLAAVCEDSSVWMWNAI